MISKHPSWPACRQARRGIILTRPEIGLHKIPLLARRGGTNEEALKALTNELACRRQVTGW
jgi:succinyl-CoA synthetase beta subunit